MSDTTMIPLNASPSVQAALSDFKIDRKSIAMFDIPIDYWTFAGEVHTKDGYSLISTDEGCHEYVKDLGDGRRSRFCMVQADECIEGNEDNIRQTILFFYSKGIQSDSTDPDEHWEALDGEELMQHLGDVGAHQAAFMFNTVIDSFNIFEPI